MGIDVQHFIEKTQPTNILSVVDKDVLQSLLDGYCHALSAGVSVLFKTDTREPSIETLDRKEALAEKSRTLFHPFCSYYRSECGCDV